MDEIRVSAFIHKLQTEEQFFNERDKCQALLSPERTGYF
jgi:hypothetical protein